jgi:hypothetical protein
MAISKGKRKASAAAEQPQEAEIVESGKDEWYARLITAAMNKLKPKKTAQTAAPAPSAEKPAQSAKKGRGATDCAWAVKVADQLCQNRQKGPVVNSLCCLMSKETIDDAVKIEKIKCLQSTKAVHDVRDLSVHTASPLHAPHPVAQC